MTTMEAAVAVASLVALMYVPGAGFGVLAGLRGVVLLGAAPAITAVMVGATTYTAGAVDVRWGLGVYLLGTLLLWGVGAALGWWRRRTGALWRTAPRAGLAQSGALAAAWLVAATIAFVAIRQGMGSPAALLQSWDSVFHLNGVQAVRELGNASPVGGLNSLYGSRAPVVYYPSVWHALVALAPGAVPVVANASTVVVACVVWPLGLAGLARVAVPQLPQAAVLAPVVGAGFLAFPTVLLSTSGQWPNGLAVAVLPGTVALVALVLRSRARDLPSSALVALPAVGGSVMIHASAAFALVLLVAPLLVVSVLGAAVAAVRAGRWWLLAAGAAVVVVLVAVAWYVLAGATVLQNTLRYPRPAQGTVWDGARDGLLDVPVDAVPGVPGGWTVLVLVLLGCVATLALRRGGWLVVSWLAAVGLVALATGPENDLRWLAGFWYKDVPRVAALVAVPASVLGALGAAWVGRGAARLVGAQGARRSAGGRHEAVRRTPRAAVATAWAVPVLAVALAWGASGGFRHDASVDRMAQAYDPDRIAHGTMATAEEVEMLRGLGEVLGDDAVLLGDPMNGAAFAYAVSGVDVVMPQLSAAYADVEQLYLEQHLREIMTDPKVCESLDALGVTHVYLDAPGWISGTDVASRFPGFYGVDVTEGFELVVSAGTASVHEVTACG